MELDFEKIVESRLAVVTDYVVMMTSKFYSFLSMTKDMYNDIELARSHEYIIHIVGVIEDDLFVEFKNIFKDIREEKVLEQLYFRPECIHDHLARIRQFMNDNNKYTDIVLYYQMVLKNGFHSDTVVHIYKRYIYPVGDDGTADPMNLNLRLYISEGNCREPESFLRISHRYNAISIPIKTSLEDGVNLNGLIDFNNVREEIREQCDADRLRLPDLLLYNAYNIYNRISAHIETTSDYVLALDELGDEIFYFTSYWFFHDIVDKDEELFNQIVDEYSSVLIKNLKDKNFDLFNANNTFVIGLANQGKYTRLYDEVHKRIQKEL